MRRRREYAPRVPQEQRRAQLLDAALQLVVTEGHSAVTMDAVARRAGVTKPVVYGLFSSRKDLLAALLLREQEQALAQLVTILPGRVSAQPEPSALLPELLGAFLRAVQEAPERWYCIVMPLPDMPAEFHAAREDARAMVLRNAEDLGRWLVKTLGAPTDLDPELLAHTMVSLAEMAARLVLTDPAQFRPERFVAGLSAALSLARRPR